MVHDWCCVVHMCVTYIVCVCWCEGTRCHVYVMLRHTCAQSCDTHVWYCMVHVCVTLYGIHVWQWMIHLCGDYLINTCANSMTHMRAVTLLRMCYSSCIYRFINIWTNLGNAKGSAESPAGAKIDVAWHEHRVLRHIRTYQFVCVCGVYVQTYLHQILLVYSNIHEYVFT